MTLYIIIILRTVKAASTWITSIKNFQHANTKAVSVGHCIDIENCWNGCTKAKRSKAINRYVPVFGPRLISLNMHRLPISLCTITSLK